MKLTVVDGEPKGHYLGLHFRIILREAVRRGWQVHLVTTQRALDHQVFAMLNEEFAGKFSTSLMTDIVNSENFSNKKKIWQHFQRWFAMRDGFRASLRDFQPDIVYQVALEKSDLPMGVLGSPYDKAPFVGLLMNRYFHAPTMGLRVEKLSRRDRLMGWAYERLLRIPTLQRIVNIDPLLTEYPKKMGWRGADKGIYIPDTGAYKPFEIRPGARAHFGVPEDKFVLLNYGAMTPRKGVAEMIAGLAHPDCPAHVVGLHAGRSDAGVKEMLAGETAQRLVAEGRLFVHDRFLSDEEECAAFVACDVAWLGYIHFFGMSSVLINAGTMGKPVLAQNQGLCDHFVLENNLGEVANVFDPADVAQALARLSTRPKETQAQGENNRRFSENHRSELFGQRICDVLATAGSADAS
ncbi:MAG: glycosyltransferase family 4 protein [Chthonomonas sp.]|nr:glycosyltransferase family 4 protein [Chthonomonas sp.]